MAATSSAITITDPAPAPVITLSDLGTAQEASAGAGVTVTESVAAPGLSSLYEAVYTASGVNESGWQQVSLDANGSGTFSVNLAHTGDYVKAVDNLDAPAVAATSSAITITDPAPAPNLPSHSASTLSAGSGAGEIIGPDKPALEVSARVEDPSPHAAFGTPTQTAHDRFVLTSAQEKTSYEQTPALDYGPAGQAPSGALARILLQHLSHLTADTILPHPSLALHEFMHQPSDAESFVNHDTSSPSEPPQSSPDFSLQHDKSHLVNLDPQTLHFFNEHFH